MRLLLTGLVCALSGLALQPLSAQANTGCGCDVSKPETLAARECGLTREAEKHPPEVATFILKDINPRKPNRWLALPRSYQKNQYLLSDMSSDERLKLWETAIAKGKEMFGDRWALAMNGVRVRTQCHVHVHIGRLIEGLETERFIVVDGPEQIPVPTDGTGLWVYPKDGKLVVHLGEQLTETVLLR